VSVGIDGDGTPTSKHLSFAVTNTAVSNSNSTGGDSRFFSCDLTRGGHPYVVDQTTTVDGLLPISTMQSRGIGRRCEMVFALITTTEQPNGHSRHAMAFRIHWRRISRLGYIRASFLITIAGKLLGLQLLPSEALLAASKEQFH